MNEDRYIPLPGGAMLDTHEIRMETMRAGGPGGQHQNTSDTAVALILSVASSKSLDEEAKSEIFRRLAGKLSRDGELRVVSRTSRSQKANREIAMNRLVDMLHAALTTQKKRRRTRVSLAAKRRRVESKRRHGEKKAQRAKPDISE
ncbi:aminoacyl-tRNA hydrolase [Oceanidesulfovibrio indonesiensis]|uniref:Aminoacyl-tRNA hydrolase n=1 Tax=Oceanidesulfovibrio indonesiensis TaxID=54767 RepID=A0A7M3MJQ3_9BACT|nr:alternative ribosome rescue aminoacyl-tRNA hydrolase ArfB [Oceanidesulfovibrio indonesiensis]TVM20024.1 aminoacyl-tRNA hydrolase [Oceanidesulfovibrio indonesiensis]